MSEVPASLALIGFGEVGQIFARQFLAGGVGAVSAYDPAFADPASRQSLAAREIGVAVWHSAPEAVAEQPLVISAVTAAAALAAARAALGGLKRGAFFMDVNSVSPGVKRQIWELTKTACGRFVEASVMSTIGPRGIRSPILTGGRYTAEFAAFMAPLGMDLTPAGEEIGRAASIKMCRSIVIKGMEALSLEMLLTARAYGVEDEVLASLADTVDTDWRALMTHMSRRALIHGRRRAEEMREAARTVTEAGLAPLQSAAAAQRQDWAADLGAALGRETAERAPLAELLDKSRALALVRQGLTHRPGGGNMLPSTATC